MADKKPRNRSPEHPAFGLQKAIERALTLYEAEHFSYANKATAMGHWGYGPKSSSGGRTLAALIHFGLLDEEGSKESRRVCISPLAKEILLREEGSAERRQALKGAALTPKIYSSLWDEVGGSGRLPSDRELRFKLEMEWNFNPTVIDRFISDFRSTLQLANLLGNGLDSGFDDPSESPEDERTGARSPGGVPSSTKQRERAMPSVQESKQQVRDLTIPLIGGGMAVLSTPVPLSEDNFVLMQTFLETFKQSLTETVSHNRANEEETVE